MQLVDILLSISYQLVINTLLNQITITKGWRNRFFEFLLKTAFQSTC